MKKIISIMLTIVMVISLFGCTGNTNTETHGHDHETTAPVETTVTTEPNETVGNGNATEPVETTVPNETEGETETTVPDETEGTEPVVTEPVVNTQPVETEPAETTNKQESNEGNKSDDIIWTECNETVYATSTVNVRAGAGTSYDKLGSLSKGDSIKRTATGSNGWSRIEYNGKTAYVSSNYISTTKPATNTGSNSGNTENSDSGNNGNDSGSNNGNSGSCTCVSGLLTSNAGCTAHPGCYWDHGTNKWIAHDCATEGHKWGYTTVSEKTCTTTAIYEYHCQVRGCNASYTEKGTDYKYHVMDADLVTKGDFKGYAIRCHCGLVFRGATYEGAYGQYEKYLTEGSHYNDTNHDIDFIHIEYYEVYPEHFTCLTCGQTLCTAEVKYELDGSLSFSTWEDYTP